jgi:hypothetical protein
MMVASRGVTRGRVSQLPPLFNALASADQGGILAGIRPAVEGKSVED